MVILPVSRGWFNKVDPWERSRSTATRSGREQGGVEHVAQNLLYKTLSVEHFAQNLKCGTCCTKPFDNINECTTMVL